MQCIGRAREVNTNPKIRCKQCLYLREEGKIPGLALLEPSDEVPSLDLRADGGQCWVSLLNHLSQRNIFLFCRDDGIFVPILVSKPSVTVPLTTDAFASQLPALTTFTLLFL